jgi:geranylgeranyl transferase type-1 subunit beta
MEEPKFRKELHIKYWSRCLKSLLPNAYTSTDSSRMTLAFFILSALDLLGASSETISEDDKKAFGTWILHCEHPNGGFCGSPNHRYRDKHYGEPHQPEIAPANLAATFFALLALGLLGGIRRAWRLKCLRWLKKLQRDDGSFGEFLGRDGSVQGGRDMRYCYLAASVRWMCKGDLGPLGKGEGEYEDIDVANLVKHIQSGQTYDGGFAESSRHESHSGYTYCAIAALAALDQMDATKSSHNSPIDASMAVRWLLSRQVEFSERMENGYPDDVHDGGVLAAAELSAISKISIHEPIHLGFNGRLNKDVDTCYCFWNCGSLETLGKGGLVDYDSVRRFLLVDTQHIIGGFGKAPSEPPDIYHSYLGVATLAMMNEPGVKPLDPVLCVSAELRDTLQETPPWHDPPYTAWNRAP